MPNPMEAELMSYEDKTIICEDCGAEFIHSGDDQARYAERGFTNEPKRCRDCRAKRKSSSPRGGGGGGGGGGYGGGGGSRPPREFHTATCDACGTQTEVPFKPVEGRPVYCRDCYRSRSS